VLGSLRSARHTCGIDAVSGQVWTIRCDAACSYRCGPAGGCYEGRPGLRRMTLLDRLLAMCTTALPDAAGAAAASSSLSTTAPAVAQGEHVVAAPLGSAVWRLARRAQVVLRNARGRRCSMLQLRPAPIHTQRRRVAFRCFSAEARAARWSRTGLLRSCTPGEARAPCGAHHAGAGHSPTRSAGAERIEVAVAILCSPSSPADRFAAPGGCCRAAGSFGAQKACWPRGRPAVGTGWRCAHHHCQ
jgi:hypothetical protein